MVRGDLIMSFTPSENPITHPERESYTELRPFRFWCQKVLPLVYDDSLSYYELLCKVVDYLNKTMEDVDHMNTDMDTLYTNFQSFQEGTFRIYNELVQYVNNYFENLSVQNEINTKLDQMARDGTLTLLMTPVMSDLISTWLDENIGPTTPAIDKTLTVENAGADSYVVGKRALLSNGQVPHSSDLNTYTSSGVWTVLSNDVLNWAFGYDEWGTLIVFNGRNQLANQTKFTIQIAISTENKFAYRTYLDSSFTPWQNLADTDKTLTIENKSADAKTVGINFRGLTQNNEDISFNNENILNNNAYSCVNGYYDGTGTFISSTGINQSLFIPVVGGMEYSLVDGHTRIFWYDADYNFISETTSLETYSPFNAPLNARYCKVPYSGDLQMIQNGASIKNIKQKNINVNVFNKNIILKDKTLRNDDAVIAANGVFVTDYIECEVGDLFEKPSSNTFVMFYDENFSLVRNLGSGNATKYIEPFVGEKYFRTADSTSILDTFYIYKKSVEDQNTNPKNLYESTEDNLYHCFINQNNALITNFNLGQTGAIEVEYPKRYSALVGTFVLWYDQTNTYIGATESNAHAGYVIPPVNAKYGRFIFIESETPAIYGSGIYEEEENKLLEDKIYCGFGDSITFRENWCRIVEQKLGCKFVNCGVSTAPIAGDSTLALWKDTHLDPVLNSNADIITILGGANDLNVTPIGDVSELSKPIAEKNKMTFYGAYSYIIESILNNDNTVKIVILSTTWAHNNGTDYSQTQTFDMFADACKNIAYYYGLPFVDLYHECEFNKYTMSTEHKVYSSDNIHPNYKGAQLIGSLVVSKFEECFKYI